MTFDQWVQRARDCPEQSHRKRLLWMKTQYGLGQNQASLALNTAFPTDAAWADPESLRRTLWSDSQASALFERLRAVICTHPLKVALRTEICAWM